MVLSKRFDNDIHRGVPSRSGREGTVHMATIGDVAKEAGVSISTVSYALSGKRAITEETRVKVLDAARRLGYAPQAAARALAARRSDLLAVTTPLHADTDHSAHMAFAMAVTRAARARDYDTVLLVHDDALEGMRRSAATSLADGIVVLDVAADDARAELARTLDCPVVFIGLPSDTAGLTCVDLDFDAATCHAVDALADAGHRSVGLISQRRETIARQANYPLRIEQAFARRAQERGLAYAVVHPEEANAARPVAELLAALPDLTGVVLSSLAGVASTLVSALGARGLVVPHDVSVVATGMTPDWSSDPLPFDSLPLDPALTCPVAVDLLVGIIDGSVAAGGVVLVPPVYQPHGSVAPPRVRSSAPTPTTQ